MQEYRFYLRVLLMSHKWAKQTSEKYLVLVTLYAGIGVGGDPPRDRVRARLKSLAFIATWASKYRLNAMQACLTVWRQSKISSSLKTLGDSVKISNVLN